MPRAEQRVKEDGELSEALAKFAQGNTFHVQFYYQGTRGALNPLPASPKCYRMR